MSRADPKLVAEIVEQIKRQGTFDDFRKSCLIDLDDNEQYKKLIEKVESYVKNYLVSINPRFTNKQRFRDQLRMKLSGHGFVQRSVSDLIDCLINQSKIDHDLYPEVERLVCRQMGLKTPERHPEQSNEEAKGCDTVEEQIDVYEGAELSVHFNCLDDFNEQNMEIDSDTDESIAVAISGEKTLVPDNSSSLMEKSPDSDEIPVMISSSHSERESSSEHHSSLEPEDSSLEKRRVAKTHKSDYIYY